MNKNPPRGYRDSVELLATLYKGSDGVYVVDINDDLDDVAAEKAILAARCLLCGAKAVFRRSRIWDRI